MSLVELFPYLLVLAKVLLYGVAVVFFISGVDDLFIDIYYGIRSLYRRLFILRKYRPLTEEQLHASLGTAHCGLDPGLG